MEFLNPTALYAFSLLPFLLIPYLIRRPKRHLFSSLLLFNDLSSRSPGRPWGALRLPPIFFLQLFLLSLLIFALGEPVFSFRLTKVALVLDNSASMQAWDGGKSRFDRARDEVSAILGGLPSNARVDLYATVPRLERVGEEALSREETKGLLAKLTPYDLGEPQVEYGPELSRLAREKGYGRLFFFTDRPSRGQGGAVRVISIGRPQENLALTSFEIVRPSFASTELVAQVEVTNFSSREWKVKTALKGSGKALASQMVAVGPRKSAQASFQGFPLHPYYEAELDVRDGLALDNRRFAVPPPAQGLKILAISPRPQALHSLRSIPGLDLTVISPEDYWRSAGDDHRLEIFHFSSPATLPRSHALLVLPPEQNPVAELGKAVSQPAISGWSEAHALTRYINFALFRPAYSRSLKPRSFGESIIESPQGPLAIALERGGFRYLILGFDPFPYLGKENLPISVFTLNFLRWFDSGGGLGAATGAPLTHRPRHRGGVLQTPTGEKFPIQEAPALFSRTFFQGIYRVARGKESELVAINFSDSREADLSVSIPVRLSAEPETPSSPSFLFSLWPYLLLLSLLLLLFEWYLNPPVRQT